MISNNQNFEFYAVGHSKNSISFGIAFFKVSILGLIYLVIFKLRTFIEFNV